MRQNLHQVIEGNRCFHRRWIAQGLMLLLDTVAPFGRLVQRVCGHFQLCLRALDRADILDALDRLPELLQQRIEVVAVGNGIDARRLPCRLGLKPIGLAFRECWGRHNKMHKKIKGNARASRVVCQRALPRSVKRSPSAPAGATREGI